MMDMDLSGPFYLSRGPVLVAFLFAQPSTNPAHMAKADMPNEKWITLSGHGKNGEKGEGHVHVKVKVGPDGSAHVITGPGELRGLRLTRLASPEQLAQRRKTRQEEAKVAKKQTKEDAAKNDQTTLEESAADPEAAQRHAQEKLAAQAKQKSVSEKRQQLEDDMKKLHGQLLEHAAKVTGDQQYSSGVAAAGMDEDLAERYKGQQQAAAQDWYVRNMPPTEGESPETSIKDAKGAGSVVAANNIRRISSSLKALRRDLVSSLVKDPELRAAVLGAGDEVPLPVSTHVSASPGYQRQTGAQAAAQGFTPEDAKQEANQVFDTRMSNLHMIGKGEKAEAITELRAGTQRRAAVLRAMKDAPKPAGLASPAPTSKVTPQEVKEHAEDVRHFLKLHDQLQQLERQKRALGLSDDPEAVDKELHALNVFDREPGAGAEIGSSVSQVEDAFAEKLDKEINDAAKTDTTRAFLDNVNEDAAQGGYAQDLIRKAMMAHIGTGAYAHLSNAAQVALGHEGLDRQVVDALGTDAAAQLVAHAMRRDLDSDTLSDVRAGLAQAHQENSLIRMTSAMELASAARATTAEIHLPAVTSGLDAAALADLQRQKKEAVGQAHEALGTALGEVEAGAALNLALKGGSKASMNVRMGDVPTAQAATQLRALGLQDGEYTMKKDAETGALTATLSKEGMDRLTAPQNEQQRANADIAARIKSGSEDEDTFLPPGFMARDSAELSSQPDIPRSFTAPPDFSGGAAAAVSSVAASLYADGKKVSQILNHLFDVTAQDVPPGQEGDFSQAVTSMIPFTKAVQKTAKDGTPYTAQEALDVDNDPQVLSRLSDLARQHVAAHAPGEADFNSQRLSANMQTKDALFRALASDPALQAAFTPPAELGGSPEGRQQAMAIRNYAMRTLFKDRLRGLSPKDFDTAEQAKQDQAIDACGPAPEKWGEAEGSLFGGPTDDTAKLSLNPHATPEQQAAALKEYGLSPEHYTLEGNAATLNDAGKAVLTVPDSGMTVSGEAGGDAVVQGGLDNLNPQWVAHQRKVSQAKKQFATTSDLWSDFKATVGGPRMALKAVQEVMKGDLAQRFAAQHASLTGQQLRVSTTTTENWERRLAATDPKAAEDVRRRDRAYMDAVRQRDSSGRYGQMGEGGVTAAVQAHVEKLARAKLMQGGLGFGDLMDARGGGEVESRDVRHLHVGPHERVTLGSTAEAQLADMTGKTRWGMKPGDGPVDLIPDLGWGKGTKHVGKQRGVKLLTKTGRLLGLYGAGSGKTAMQLGGFTQAHSEGRAKKAFLVVPSIVRNQFGEEAARFLEPGKYSWHAEDASYAERKGHYQGDTHMVVTTHATFRDDMIKLMAEHQGKTPAELGSHFDNLSRPERADALRDALAHHQIPLDYLAIDEAHDFLNRAGKQDSLMSKVAEAAMDNSKFKSLWTGSPVKNDSSEIYDWISKVDPARFKDRGEFMRKYGVNTVASQDSLKRLMDSYAYVDSVTPDVQRTVTWGARGADGAAAVIALSPAQQDAYQGVHTAFGRASAAQRRGDVDVEACKTLSPNSFKDQPQEEHRRISAQLQNALGTLKHGALGRVVNEHEAGSNAKIQHVLGLASARRGKGGVVFARNRKSVAMLRDQLIQAGHKVGVIDGSSSSEEKARVRKAFDAGGVDIVVCSDAGATGANLQKRGKWLVNYDLPLTQKTLEQRVARIDRLGQKDPIELHHLVTDTPFDRDNVRRLDRKAELGSILQGEFRSLDDDGLAAHIRRARAERLGDHMPSWEEPLGRIDENAKPTAPKLDVPKIDAPPTAAPQREAPSVRA